MFSKKSLILLICLLFIILLAFLVTDSYIDLKRDLRIYTADAIDIIDQRMTSLLSEVNIFPQHTGNDLLFLCSLSNLRDVVDSAEQEEINLSYFFPFPNVYYKFDN